MPRQARELLALARTSRPTVVPFGCAFQTLFSAACISPKTPEAVTTSVTMPIAAASMPDDLLLELATAVCRSSAVCRPMRSPSWDVIAPWAACWPYTSPAIAMTISRTGAKEVAV